jgi:OFA family oxalate/formate antiporter-like MFS transporter
MVKSPVFWLLYAMFVLVAASGLTAQVAPIARKRESSPCDRHHAQRRARDRQYPQWFGAAGLRLGFRSDRSRSDNERGVHARRVGLLGLGLLGHTPVMFILLASLVFFTWGEIFSLFPAIATDTYGAKYATANAGLLYTAKGMAVRVVPLASVVKNHTGSWHWVFVIAAIMNLTVAVLALLVLKPIRRRIITEH